MIKEKKKDDSINNGKVRESDSVLLFVVFEGTSKLLLGSFQNGRENFIKVPLSQIP